MKGPTQRSASRATGSGRPAPEGPRRAIVVQAADGGANGGVRALAQQLSSLGIDAVCFEEEWDASRLAEVVITERAAAVELFLPPAGGVIVLRDLLRELIRVGRRDVSIVVHRLH